MSKETARWVYRDQSGKVWGYVCRIEDGTTKSNGKPAKEIIPFFTPDGNGDFTKGIPDSLKIKMPLYGLDSLKNPIEPIYIVEGEKCARALHGLGFQAVTSQGGSTAAHQTDWQPLHAYKKIVILPDNDAAGERYSETIYKRLIALSPDAIASPIAPSIEICRLPNLPKGGDVCDYLQAIAGFHDWNGLNSIADHPYRTTAIECLSIAIPLYSASIPSSWRYIESSKGLRAFSYSAFDALEFPPRDILLAPWLAQNSINLIFAERGIGKTYFCLSCAIALAEGGTFILYRAAKPATVLYLDGEMQASVLRDRIRNLTDDVCGLVKKNLYIVTPDCQYGRDMPNLSTHDGMKDIDDLIEQIKPDVIFIDNLSTFIRSGIENEGESWLPVQEWAIRHRSNGRALIFVHHTNKEGKQRGTSRKEDVQDVVIQLKRPEDYNAQRDGARFEVTYTKSRNLHGDAIAPITATLIETDNGKFTWEWEGVGDNWQEALAMKKAGKTLTEISAALGVPKSTLCRRLKNAST